MKGGEVFAQFYGDGSSEDSEFSCSRSRNPHQRQFFTSGMHSRLRLFSILGMTQQSITPDVCEQLLRFLSFQQWEFAWSVADEVANPLAASFGRTCCYRSPWEEGTLSRMMELGESRLRLFCDVGMPPCPVNCVRNPLHNPCHPSVVAGGIKSGPRPTQAMPPDIIKNEVTSLLEEAKWTGDDEMKPWDGDWVAEYMKKAAELQTWLCTPAKDDRKLWNKMPRNPATLCYKN